MSDLDPVGPRSLFPWSRDAVASSVPARQWLPALGAGIAFACLAVLSLAPMGDQTTAAVGAAELAEPATQSYVVADPELPSLTRDSFAVTRISTAPPVGKPDPGTAQAIAYRMVEARGWSPSEYQCLVALWNRESHWNVYAENPTSGAYGIPQALPGNKMATAGADWRTNPETQITWGLGYISGRYGTPCAAWDHSERRGWY